MRRAAGHVSDDELTELTDYDDAAGRAGRRVREHVQECEACRHRRDELIGMRELLAQTGHRERRPLRDVVPSAMMRLRLRRHSVTNMNELLEGFAALVRSVTSLFSLPATDRRFVGGARDVKDDRHE